MADTSDEFNELVRNASENRAPDSPGHPASNTYAYNMIAKHYTPRTPTSYNTNTSFDSPLSDMPDSQPQDWTEKDVERWTWGRSGRPPGFRTTSSSQQLVPNDPTGHNSIITSSSLSSHPKTGLEDGILSGNEKSSGASGGFITDTSNVSSRPDSPTSSQQRSHNSGSASDLRRLHHSVRGLSRSIAGHMPIRHGRSDHGIRSHSHTLLGGSQAGHRNVR